MKLFVAILAILAIAIAQDSPLCNNNVVDDEDSVSFSLASLKLDSGYYQYTDAQTGKIYIWNICGALDEYCGPNAAACISESGDLSVPEFTRAASYDSFDYSISAGGDVDSTIQVTFFDGDWCEEYQTNRSITFVYHCASDYGNAVAQNIDTTDDCENVKIDIYTSAACGMSYLDGDYEPQWNHWSRVYFKALMIFIWVSVGLSLCLCCCALCAIVRRRRCQKSGKCGYQKVTQTVELTQPTTQVSAKPTAPVQNQATQTVPQMPYGMPLQYVPAPQYYYYMPQAQAPVVQQPPVVQLEEVQHNSQMDADEKLARELQAKFNQEV